jgi:hypothetical protein
MMLLVLYLDRDCRTSEVDGLGALHVSAASRAALSANLEISRLPVYGWN